MEDEFSHSGELVWRIDGSYLLSIFQYVLQTEKVATLKHMDGSYSMWQVYIVHQHASINYNKVLFFTATCSILQMVLCVQ